MDVSNICTITQIHLFSYQIIALALQNGSTVAGNTNGGQGSTLRDLSSPFGIALSDNDSLYVSDTNNHRIMLLTNQSLSGSKVAGTGSSGNDINKLNKPSALVLNSTFNMVIADSLNHRILFWRYNESMSYNSLGTGSSVSSDIGFRNPSGLVIDSLNNIYVSDSGNHRIMKWSVDATIGQRVIGTGIVGNSNETLNTPMGIFLDEINNYLYIADSNNHRIQRCSTNVGYACVTVAGGNGAGSANNQLDQPYSVYVSKFSGDVYIADRNNDRVQIWRNGAQSGLTLVGTSGISAATSWQLQLPAYVLANYRETYLYVCDEGNNRVQRFTLI